MIIKIKRKACLEKYPLFPLSTYVKAKDDYDEFFPESYKSYVLTVTGKSFKGKVKRLGEEIRKMLKEMGFNDLIFLGHNDTPWRYRNSDYKPAEAALDYLKNNKIGKKFKGGMKIGIDDIPIFIVHLSWLTRTNTVLPYVYFTNTEHNIIGHVCQYGNLHLQVLNEAADLSVMPVIAACKFKFLIDQHCTLSRAKGVT